MPIPFRQPELDEHGWEAHAAEVDLCRGGVCFHVVANHFKARSPKALEKRADGRQPYISQDGVSSGSGKYSKWLRDGSAPSDKTVDDLWRKTDGAIRLDYWRDHPLWTLLRRDPPPVSWLQKVRERMPRAISLVLFDDGLPVRNRFIHRRLARADYLTLRDQGTFEAFTTLLAFAREGEIVGHDPSHFLPSACAFDMLPKVLLSVTHLHTVWDTFFRCLDRVYFHRSWGEGIYFSFEKSVVDDAMDALALDPEHKWPSLAGKNA